MAISALVLPNWNKPSEKDVQKTQLSGSMRLKTNNSFVLPVWSGQEGAYITTSTEIPGSKGIKFPFEGRVFTTCRSLWTSVDPPITNGDTIWLPRGYRMIPVDGVFFDSDIELLTDLVFTTYDAGQGNAKPVLDGTYYLIDKWIYVGNNIYETLLPFNGIPGSRLRLWIGCKSSGSLLSNMTLGTAYKEAHTRDHVNNGLDWLSGDGIWFSEKINNNQIKITIYSENGDPSIFYGGIGLILPGYSPSSGLNFRNGSSATVNDIEILRTNQVGFAKIDQINQITGNLSLNRTSVLGCGNRSYWFKGASNDLYVSVNMTDCSFDTLSGAFERQNIPIDNNSGDEGIRFDDYSRDCNVIRTKGTGGWHSAFAIHGSDAKTGQLPQNIVMKDCTSHFNYGDYGRALESNGINITIDGFISTGQSSRSQLTGNYLVLKNSLWMSRQRHLVSTEEDEGFQQILFTDALAKQQPSNIKISNNIFDFRDIDNTGGTRLSVLHIANATLNMLVVDHQYEINGNIAITNGKNISGYKFTWVHKNTKDKVSFVQDFYNNIEASDFDTTPEIQAGRQAVKKDDPYISKLDIFKGHVENNKFLTIDQTLDIIKNRNDNVSQYYL